MDPGAELGGESVSALAAKAADFADVRPFDGFGDFNGLPTAGAVE
jgi:2-amino-4-hydroxy-6-hydroxymethyldihydropteridine diphosphokinase